MAKQRRFRSEAQIECMIDRARELEAGDIAQIAVFNDQIEEGRKHGNANTINFAKGMILTLEKRIKGRNQKVERLKAKLSEFRTLTLPGLGYIMTDQSIAQ